MSSSAKIAVIDNGICNLRSVTKAFEAVGATPVVVHSPADIGCEIDGLMLPGVGALGDCVAALRASKLDDTVRGWIKDGRPFLGVCLGMQALFDSSEESGGVTGLGIFPGKVVRFRRPPEFKIPHMGWNAVRFTQPESPLANSLNRTEEAFYFVHSFHCVPEDSAFVLGECDYGGAFTAAIGRGQCFATQFHPEKSQAKGLQIYRNFADVAAGALTA